MRTRRQPGPFPPAKARRPTPIFRPISKGGPSWVATRRMPNRRRKPEWTCTAPQIFSPLFSRTRPPRNRRHSPLRHPSSSMRPTAPAAAGWRVIRWRKPPSPTQRQKAKPPLPLRTRCPLCRRCRQAFPSSRLPRMLLFRRKPRCFPREATPARPMLRRFSPARPTGPLLRMSPLPFRRKPGNSPRTRLTPYFTMLRTSRPSGKIPLTSPPPSCEILSLPLCMRMPRRKNRPIPAFPRRTGRAIRRPVTRRLPRLRPRRAVPSAHRFVPRAWPR